MAFSYNFFTRIKKNHLSPFDRLSHCERQLNEFICLEKEKKLDGFSNLLKPAISRLYSILTDANVNNYDKIELLKADYLFIDIDITPYCNKECVVVYQMLKCAKKLKYPEGEYKIINSQTGEYELNGISYYSDRIAIDDYLDSICKRWLGEIEEIKKVVSHSRNNN